MSRPHPCTLEDALADRDYYRDKLLEMAERMAAPGLTLKT